MTRVPPTKGWGVVIHKARRIMFLNPRVNVIRRHRNKGRHGIIIGTCRPMTWSKFHSKMCLAMVVFKLM